jgi:hypothetical protein
MTPVDLKKQLTSLVEKDLDLSVMIWGPPGIGKSSIVSQVAQENDMEFTDLRLSQLSPTDLRGLPVPNKNKMSWLPPDFLPHTGSGILFLDEINLAPPAIQGIAQQLVLDRRVGNLELPQGWHVWAAGNRKEDRASVFDMPAPLANRFLHFDVNPDFASFRKWAIANEVDERIISLLAFRPDLLHQYSDNSQAWPSARTWAMADRLLRAGLPIDSAVGEGPAGEFEAYVRVYTKLPDLEAILRDAGGKIRFPREASIRFATTTGLGLRAKTHSQTLSGFRWLTEHASPEWIQLYLCNVMEHAKAQGHLGMIATALRDEPGLRKFITEYRELELAA